MTLALVESASTPLTVTENEEEGEAEEEEERSGEVSEAGGWLSEGSGSELSGSGASSSSLCSGSVGSGVGSSDVESGETSEPSCSGGSGSSGTGARNPGSRLRAARSSSGRITDTHPHQTQTQQQQHSTDQGHLRPRQNGGTSRIRSNSAAPAFTLPKLHLVEGPHRDAPVVPLSLLPNSLGLPHPELDTDDLAAELQRCSVQPRDSPPPLATVERVRGQWSGSSCEEWWL
jgi:hypothetical protein